MPILKNLYSKYRLPHNRQGRDIHLLKNRINQQNIQFVPFAASCKGNQLTPHNAIIQPRIRHSSPSEHINSFFNLFMI
jgi:hypothetical protein